MGRKYREGKTARRGVRQRRILSVQEYTQLLTELHKWAAIAEDRYEPGDEERIVLSAREYKELLKDLDDLRVIAERKGESTESLEQVRARLEKSWRPTE